MPFSSLTKMTFTANSGVPPNIITHGAQEIDLKGVKLGANSVPIPLGSSIHNALQSGNTISHSLQLEYSGISVVSTAGTPYVSPPPPPVMLHTNGATLKYTLSSIPSGQSNPYIIQVPEGSGTYYAIMSSNNDDSKSKIQAYAMFVGSNPNPTTATPSFTAPDNTPIPFNRIVTTLMTNMSLLFYDARGFNQPINSWDTSNVTDMGYMFYLAEKFDSDIGNWNTSKVINMSGMFGITHKFNSDIGNWDVSSVIDMNSMFFYAQAFSQDISAWNVTSVQPKPPINFIDNSGITNTNLLPPAFL
jgi:surface protein